MNKLVDRFKINRTNTTDIVPIRAGYQRCSPGYNWGPVTRNSYTIQYVLDGCGTVYKNGQKFEVNSTECFILRPGETFRLHSDSVFPWTYIWIGFTHSLDIPELYSEDVFPAKDLEELFLKIAECNTSSNQPLEPLLISYIWELIFLLKKRHMSEVEQQTRPDYYVNAACQLIHDNYSEITVDAIAGELKLNRCYLSRIFKEKIGMTIQTYLVNMRLDVAKDLLYHGYSVTMTGMMVGYSDTASFSRAFKKFYSMSPTKYVEIMKNTDEKNSDI